MTKQQKIKNLNNLIEEYMQSGMKLNAFIRKHMFEQYVNGDKELKDIAAEYFIDNLK